MQNLKRYAGILLLLLCSHSSQAIPITLDFYLTAETVNYRSGDSCSGLFYGLDYFFGCGIQSGDVFNGTLTIDSSYIISDGEVEEVPFSAFDLVIGEHHYELGTRSIDAFRSGNGLNPFGTGLVFEALKAVDFIGGVAGEGDINFVSFYRYNGLGRNTFFANDRFVEIWGSVSFTPPRMVVPEPSVLSLFALLLLFPAWRMRVNC